MFSTAVLGLGRSGAGAARLLKKQGHRVIVFDQCKGPDQKRLSIELSKTGIEVFLGQTLEIETFKPWISQLETVVISPAIPWNHPTLNELRELGIIVKGEVAIAWEATRQYPWIGITGTNGKTTVTYLLNHILTENGLKAPLAGNVGYAASELALELLKHPSKKPDCLVIELSSYQIEAAQGIAPEIGIWTNLTPDHLERHGSIEQYRQIKRGLIERSKIKILNGDDPDLSNNQKNWDKGLWISSKGGKDDKEKSELWIDKNEMVMERDQPLFSISTFQLLGQHNLQNLLLATCAARQLGLAPEGIKRSLNNFKGVPHRLERVGQIKEINVFNDSKATNFEAASVGLDAIEKPLIVIAGGRLKSGCSGDWLKRINKHACSIILFGEGAYALKNLIDKSKFIGKVHLCHTLKQAVKIAVEECKSQNPKSLLFSPACASFDQYKDFEERGNHFKSLIKPFITE